MFATQLSKIVEHAFTTTAATESEGKPSEAAALPEAPIENQVVLPPVDASDAHAAARGSPARQPPLRPAASSASAGALRLTPGLRLELLSG